MITSAVRLFPFAPLALLALVPCPAAAQAGGSQDAGIVVRGEKLDKMSAWHVAEADHVIVYSDGSVAELTRITHNLERLHFLLSVLLNHVGQPEDAQKLRITLIGDTAEFDAMELRNIRSQQGPFLPNFHLERYYDPREDGAVMASGRTDLSVAIERSQQIQVVSMGSYSQPGGSGGDAAQTGQVVNSMFSPGQQIESVTGGGVEVPISAESRIYAGYAQHFLLTYFPAAYPRWYLDGMGELFSTIRVDADGEIQYGQMPAGYRKIIEWRPSISVKDIVTGRYLDEPVARTGWNPFHAWVLTHYLFFSDKRRPQLSRYLASIGRGATMEQAATVFGNLDKLQAEVIAYDNGKLPWVEMTYPAERAPEPVVQQLTQGQAAFLKGRIELGSRIEIPASGPAREHAIEARDRWLVRLRGDAAHYSGNLEAQLLLAEAECRTGNNAECAAAADNALALAPNDSRALAWKGIALAQQAAASSGDDRAAKLKAARALLARANRADTEGSLPLLGYYRSFADMGEAAPTVAVEGLLKAVQNVPAAPGPRLLLGEEFAREGHPDAAQVTLMPVTNGGYDSPEKPRAQAVVKALPAK